MDLQFKESRWLGFYAHYIPNLASIKPNDLGWSNFPCVLPTHPRGSSKERKGGVHLPTGLYKCWSGSCQAEYSARFYGNRLAPKADAVLAPQQFLELVDPEISPDQALESVERFRLEGGPEAHFDGEESTTPLWSVDLDRFIEEARGNLTEDLQHVLEYERTRGIRFSTLQTMGVGYVPEDGSREGCLVFPYTYRGRVVGVKARALDGRKGAMPKSYITLFGLDLVGESETILIVEGETDTLYMRQVLDDHGFTSVAAVGTSGTTFKREWVREFSSAKRIIAVPQADQASRKWVMAIRRAFASSPESEDPRVVFIELPWPRGVYGKDVSDFCRLVPEGEERLLQYLSVEEGEDLRPPYMMSMDELAEYGKVEPEELVPRLIPRRSKILVVGPPKTFKTWLCLHLIRSVVDGTPWLENGKWVGPGNQTALYVLEEGSSHSLSRRVEMVGIRGKGVHFIHRQIVQLDETGSYQKLYEAVLQVRPDLLILDPLASLHTGDENSVQDMMTLMKQLDRLLYALPRMTIVLIHHTSKGGRGARGSGAIWANADVMIEVSRPVEKNPFELEMRISGRDFEDSESAFSKVVFDPMTCSMTLSQWDPEASPTESSQEQMMQMKVREAIGSLEAGSWFNVYSILGKPGFGMSEYEPVRRVCLDLVSSGELEVVVASTLPMEERPAGGSPRSQTFRQKM